MKHSPSYGILVGRFQVDALHPGHLALIQAVQEKHDRVVIFVGTAPTLATTRNPLDFITRKRMLQAAFPELTVLPMPDRASDQVWSEDLDRRIREVAAFGKITLYGARDSFVPSYVGSFKPVELDLDVEGQSGEQARAIASNRVLESQEFRAGIIYSTQNRWPISLQCVDVAIFDLSQVQRVALGRKPGETLWRFPGGHVDNTDARWFEFPAVEPEMLVVEHRPLLAALVNANPDLLAAAVCKSCENERLHTGD
jgi:bifunctional NMN adenylyltransferase/nudix hydrolase